MVSVSWMFCKYLGFYSFFIFGVESQPCKVMEGTVPGGEFPWLDDCLARTVPWKKSTSKTKVARLQWTIKARYVTLDLWPFATSLHGDLSRLDTFCHHLLQDPLAMLHGTWRLHPERVLAEQVGCQWGPHGLCDESECKLSLCRIWQNHLSLRESHLEDLIDCENHILFTLFMHTLAHSKVFDVCPILPPSYSFSKASLTSKRLPNTWSLCSSRFSHLCFTQALKQLSVLKDWWFQGKVTHLLKPQTLLSLDLGRGGSMANV